MDGAHMKKNQKEAVERLKALYDKKGENQLFARMHVTLPAPVAESIKRKKSGIWPALSAATDRPLWRGQFSCSWKRSPTPAGTRQVEGLCRGFD
jgi:hypothetical protein